MTTQLPSVWWEGSWLSGICRVPGGGLEHDRPDTLTEDASNPSGLADNDAPERAGTEEALTAAGAALTDAVGSLLRIAAVRGRRRLGLAAAQGRMRMEIRQLRRDRTRMTEKLGREVIRLVEGGELDHPGLLRGVERIREQDARIEDAERAQSTSPDLDPEKIVDPSGEAK